jgi:thiamine monophosphate synthase
MRRSWGASAVAFPGAGRVAAIVPAGFRIGVSTHSLAGLRAAEDEGADFAVFGPVFYTASKAPYGAPLGIGRLREAAARCGFRCWRLGGVTAENADHPQCLEAGARRASPGFRCFR